MTSVATIGGDSVIADERRYSVCPPGRRGVLPLRVRDLRLDDVGRHLNPADPRGVVHPHSGASGSGGPTGVAQRVVALAHCGLR